MEATKSHWTEDNTADYLFRIGADFVFQLEDKFDAQKDLAKALNVTESAVSQKLNNPGNLKLQTMIKYARALGMKLSVVLYDDGDSRNERGPISAEIFRICWERAGKPADFWMVNRVNTDTATTDELLLRTIDVRESKWVGDGFRETRMAQAGGGHGRD